MSKDNTIFESEDDTLTTIRVGEPPLFKVLLLNDDFTPMGFVVEVLTQFFQKGIAEATRIMFNVHRKGSGMCGVFTRDLAETKVIQVNQFARQHGHPLKCTMEQA
jgi:ATP-dependent Clp protease adaptor protein ClpS